MKKITFGFAGLGLIGGSIAKALRGVYPDCFIVACDPNPHTLQQAQSEGIADAVTTGPDQAFLSCDFVFLCAPVGHNDENLTLLKNYLSPHCLITDVGSVKTPIHRQAAGLGLEDRFIGGHPMTGSERSGFANAKTVLLENAYYILTPAPQVPATALTCLRELVLAMGALPLVLSHEEHDYITAAVSHLPHIIAAALVRLVQNSDSADGMMKMIAAGGFKDITRIASSSPAMWQQICLANQANISRLLEEYINALTSFNEEIKAATPTPLYEFFDSARAYRDSFSDGAASGPILQSHALSVDIPDKAGALAAIVTLFAHHDINIKNIGISHNREQEEGVLLLEFYDGSSVNRSGQLLTAAGYGFHLKT